jgi:dolichol kinase
MLTKHGKMGLPIHRRIFHLVAASTFSVAGFLFHQKEVVIAAAITLLIFSAMEVMRLYFHSINGIFLKLTAPLLKGEEVEGPTGATYVIAGSLIVFVLFDTQVAALSLLFLALGDPAAGLVGENMGRTRIGRKSLEGSLAFLLVSAAAAFMVVALGGFEPLWIALVGAGVAMLVELVSSPLDDNLTVPFACGAVISLLA